MVLSSTFGNASFGLLQGTGSPSLILELIFVLETAGKHNASVDRFLPNTPLRIVVDHKGNDVTDSYSIEMLNKNLSPSEIDALLENDALVNTMLPNMISSATKIAEKLGAKKRINGSQRMKSTLDHEINRLKILQKMNKQIRPDEIRLATKERSALSTIIDNSRIRLDALLLIRKE
jgi:ATP-dependent helicase HepA